MADNATNALEERILNSLFDYAGSTSLAAAGQLTLKLYTTTPTAEDGTGGTEVSTSVWTNYSAQNIGDYSGGSNGMTVATDGSGVTTAKNTAEISFGAATISGTAPVVAGITIEGDVGSGSSQVLFYGALQTSRTVNNGDTFKFNANDLVITLA